MTLTIVDAYRITCDRPTADGDQPCPAFLLLPRDVDTDAADRAARERAWTTGASGYRCPTHGQP